MCGSGFLHPVLRLCPGSSAVITPAYAASITAIPFLLHIFGLGKSCVQLFTLQARPLTSGSNTIQYVVFIHSFDTPRVELIQDCPPSSLRKRPISVVVINCRW